MTAPLKNAADSGTFEATLTAKHLHAMHDMALFGFVLHEVEPGTVIRDERTDQEFEVTETSAVFKGPSDLYITPAMCKAFKSHPDVRNIR